MAYTPKGYTDKEAIEKYMLIDIDVQWDEKLDEWMCLAENIVEQETNRTYDVNTEEDETERIYDGDGTDTLAIDPATDIVSVKLSPEGTALDTDQYYLYPANSVPKTKIKLRYMRFPEGNQNILVTAAFGRAQVPADIKHATTLLVAGIINGSWPSEGEIQSMTVGGYSVSYKTAQQREDLLGLQEIFDRNKRYTF